MSNNAYKVIKIKTEKEPTFSIWHDDYIVDRFALCDQLNTDGGGIVTISKDDVEDALKNIKDDELSPEEEKHYISILKNIIKDMVGDESVSYICG